MIFVKDIPENVTLTFSPNPTRLDHVLKIFCKADGNPAPQKFMWYKDGQFIENNKGVKSATICVLLFRFISHIL